MRRLLLHQSAYRDNTQRIAWAGFEPLGVNANRADVELFRRAAYLRQFVRKEARGCNDACGMFEQLLVSAKPSHGQLPA